MRAGRGAAVQVAAGCSRCLHSSVDALGTAELRTVRSQGWDVRLHERQVRKGLPCSLTQNRGAAGASPPPALLVGQPSGSLGGDGSGAHEAAGSSEQDSALKVKKVSRAR